MSRFRITLLALVMLAIGISCLAQAQLPMRGAGVVPVAVASYSGPGDIVSGSQAWWGLRAYNAIYATGLGKIANVCMPLDAVCADVNSNASGNFNLSGVGALTCNNIGSICTVKTLYDQSGASNCSGPCDVTNATIANRPVLTVNCLGSLPCLTFAGAQSLNAIGTSLQLMPYTLSCVANRTGATSSFGDCIGSSSTDMQLGFANSSNTLFFFAGSGVGSVGGYSDNVWHAIQGLLNGASSSIYADGVSNSISNPGAGTASPDTLAVGNGTLALTGTWTEAGVWPTLFSGGQQSSMNTNQHTYWGF